MPPRRQHILMPITLTRVTSWTIYLRKSKFRARIQNWRGSCHQLVCPIPYLKCRTVPPKSCINVLQTVLGRKTNATKNEKLHHRMTTCQMMTFHISRASQSDHSGIASLDYLKLDDKIQRKFQRKLQQLQGTSRTAPSGNNRVKSGLHRSRDNNVKKEIGWPHHFYFPGQSGQLLDYQDLSPLQFI